MFKDAAPGVRIYCDYESRKLRVMEDVNPLPGYLPMWREVASFATIEDWRKSKYAPRVTNEQIGEMITWFWIDLSANAQ